MKALITGCNGFVGPYLRAELEKSGYEVKGLDLLPGKDTLVADLLKPEEINAVLSAEKPDLVFHLAALADVGRSWKVPRLTMEVNVVAAVNLLEALRLHAPEAATVIVGSSGQYGQLGAAGKDVTEDMEMKPLSPYAVSKRAQEELAGLYVRSYGMRIFMTRSFNHGGAGQRTGFMIPDFASGIVRIERELQSELPVGNLTSRRDFTHVKDMVRAYRLIAEKGKPGRVYNVGSGRTWSAQEVLDRLISMSPCRIPVRQDPARMRPSDTPVVCCNHERLTADTGWEPELGLEEILTDTLSYYRNKQESEA